MLARQVGVVSDIRAAPCSGCCSARGGGAEPQRVSPHLKTPAMAHVRGNPHLNCLTMCTTCTCTHWQSCLTSVWMGSPGSPAASIAAPSATASCHLASRRMAASLAGGHAHGAREMRESPL